MSKAEQIETMAFYESDEGIILLREATREQLLKIIQAQDEELRAVREEKPCYCRYVARLLWR